MASRSWGDLADSGLLDELFALHDFKCVIHFAAFSLVGESVTNPAKYYRNNVSITLNLLDTMIKHNVTNLVFSSTAATYGTLSTLRLMNSTRKIQSILMVLVN